MWAYGFVAGVIGTIGTVFLALGAAWGAVLIAVCAGAVVYGLIVPWLLPYVRDVFLSYGPENTSAGTLLLGAYEPRSTRPGSSTFFSSRRQ